MPDQTIMELTSKLIALPKRVTQLEEPEVLRDSEEQYRLLFKSNPHPMWIYDLKTLSFLAVNDVAIRQYGYSREEFLAMTIKDIRSAEDIPALLNRVVETSPGLNSAGLWKHRKKDGTIIDVEITTHVLTFEGRRAKLVLGNDVTGRKRAEEALRKAHGELALLVKERTALLEINNAIITNLDRQSLFNAITRSLLKIMPFDRALLTLYDPETDSLKVSALAGLPADQFGRVGMEIKRQGSHVGWVLDHKQYLLRRYLEKELQFPIEENILNEGIHSYIAVPLMGKGKLLGTLNVASKTSNCYSEDDAMILLEVAGQVGLAIENMLAYEEIAKFKARLEQENIYLKEEIRTEHNFEEFVGSSLAIRKVMKAIETVAPTDATVLILGETGTGKELVARAVHSLSAQKNKPLVKVNCAALAAGLIESELFGHEKGAFTGAFTRKIGRFELASGGTIFLDEIGDLPLELQAKLLRVLQEGEFERVGGSHTIKVIVRVIAATNRDLNKAVKAGSFRSDLFYRLNVFPLTLPPLRERKSDILLLVNHSLKRFTKELGKPLERLSKESMDRLMRYNWPGNVRELLNVMERSAILARGSVVHVEDSIDLRLNTTSDIPQLGKLEDVERAHIIRVLEETNWKIYGPQGAALILGLHPNTMRSRMQKLGIKQLRSIA